MTAAQDRGVPLMEGLRNLTKGYDRKFALSYCADDVWAALEALEKIAALAQSPSWEIAHDVLQGKLHPPSDEGKAPAAAGQNSQRRSETGDGSTELAICPECGATVAVCKHLRAVQAGNSELDRARQAGYDQALRDVVAMQGADRGQPTVLDVPTEEERTRGLDEP